MESGRADVVKPKPAGAILIRGTEGWRCSWRCCRLFRATRSSGVIRKGQGLEVHMHDCPQARKLRGERDRWIDVEWEASSDRLFDVTSLLTQNVRAACSPKWPTPSPSRTAISRMSVPMETRGVFDHLRHTLQVTHPAPGQSHSRDP